MIYSELLSRLLYLLCSVDRCTHFSCKTEKYKI